MVQSSESRRRPRIRKSAPTVRERAEAAREKSQKEKPRRISHLLAKPAAPVRKLRLGERAPIKAARKPLIGVKKGLSWIIPRYFVNSWRELKQVVWPSRRETWRLTLAVFIFAVVFGALVAGVDKGLDEFFKKVILK